MANYKHELKILTDDKVTDFNESESAIPDFPADIINLGYVETGLYTQEEIDGLNQVLTTLGKPTIVKGASETVDGAEKFNVTKNYEIITTNTSIIFQTKDLQKVLRDGVYSDLQTHIGTTRSDTASFLYLSCRRMLESPADHVGKKTLTAEGGLAELEIMDTEQKVIDYLTAVVWRFDNYLEANWAKKVKYIEDRNAL